MQLLEGKEKIWEQRVPPLLCIITRHGGLSSITGETKISEKENEKGEAKMISSRLGVRVVQYWLVSEEMYSEKLPFVGWFIWA